MSRQAQVLVIAAPGELPPEQRIWGTGGWQEPKARAALDWLTLVALLGWDATVSDAHTVADRGVPAATRWIIVACPDECVTAGTTAAITAHLRYRPTLVVAGAGKAGRPLAELAGVSCDLDCSTGRNLAWSGPGERRNWRLRSKIESPALTIGDGANVWAQLDGGPLVAARGQDRGTVATIGFDASAARDSAGAVSALLKHMLVAGAHGPVAWLDLAGTMVLRMDDPGASQNLHLHGWRYTQLDSHAWTRIGATLQRAEARLSVGYVAGWVDDGDPARGKLELAGAAAARRAGAVHPSPGIRYVAADGSVNDYMAQYRKLLELQHRGLVGIEMHGFTHMHAALDRWAHADDRYDALAWYREFSADAAAARAVTTGEGGPLAEAAAALRRHFGATPTTLIFPGEAFTAASLAAALDLGIELIGSYYLALRRGGRFCWAQHVCAPYLDEPDAAWLDAELPTVGYFHDRDIAIEGPEWFPNQLERWMAAGVRRFVDYRELAVALARPFTLTSDATGCLLLSIENRDAPTLFRSLPIRLRATDSALPRTVTVRTAAGTATVPVTPEGQATGTMLLPVDAVEEDMAKLRA
jgi:hypothetical protein